MKLLLIQFRTDRSAAHEEACVRIHAGLHHSQLLAVNAILDPVAVETVDARSFDGLLMGGSGEFNLTETSRPLRMALDVVKPHLDKALAAQLPILGMCFGHQILAEHLGGTVARYADGVKSGTYRVELTTDGRQDVLHRDLPSSFEAQHGHKESVVAPPPGAVVLSTNNHDPHAGFRYGATTYGVQYHPELTQEDLLFRLELYPSYKGGRSGEELRQIFRPTPHPPQILRNFVDGVRQRQV